MARESSNGPIPPPRSGFPYRLVLGLLAVVCDVVGFVFAWLCMEQYDIFPGHHGPPHHVMAAFWFAAVGVVSTLGWMAWSIMLRIRLGKAGAVTKSVPGAILAVILVILLLPAGVVAWVGMDAYPRARERSTIKYIESGKASVRQLTEYLESNSDPIRISAARSLVPRGKDALPAGPRLLEAVESGSPELARVAAEALGAIGPDRIAGLEERFVQAGNARLSKGDFSAALRLFWEALAADANRLDRVRRRGLTDFIPVDRPLPGADHRTIALIYRSQIRLERGDLAGAFEDCMRASRFCQAHRHVIHVARGNVRAAMGEWHLAAGDYGTALNLAPSTWHDRTWVSGAHSWAVGKGRTEE